MNCLVRDSIGRCNGVICTGDPQCVAWSWWLFGFPRPKPTTVCFASLAPLSALHLRAKASIQALFFVRPVSWSLCLRYLVYRVGAVSCFFSWEACLQWFFMLILTGFAYLDMLPFLKIQIKQSKESIHSILLQMPFISLYVSVCRNLKAGMFRLLPLSR